QARVPENFGIPPSVTSIGPHAFEGARGPKDSDVLDPGESIIEQGRHEGGTTSSLPAESTEDHSFERPRDPESFIISPSATTI
ncbi:MAG: hypothetical protein DSZ21_02270, partial [Tenericutes bacterium]